MRWIERAVAWVAVGLGGWLSYRLFMRNGRLLLRVEELENELAQLRGDPSVDEELLEGLPDGSVMIDFALPSVSGDVMTLSQWRGQRVLLLFFDPTCDFCRKMLPDLAKLEPRPADGCPVPIIISTGSVENNRRMMEEHGICCPVLLQESNEVAHLYQVSGTPMGYLIDENGKTVGPLAAGAEAVLKLAGAVPLAPSRSDSVTHMLRKSNGTATASRIIRDGLKAGTPAPRFRLPLVTGGELALEELLGRTVLLVFSDPLCGPCNELAPKLEQLHRRVPDLQVVMISRGELVDNQAEIATYELTFPVVLQQRWEISREYGMFATPIGYLIDERGIIAKDVTVGADAILALVSANAHRSKRKEVTTHHKQTG